MRTWNPRMMLNPPTMISRPDSMTAGFAARHSLRADEARHHREVLKVIETAKHEETAVQDPAEHEQVVLVLRRSDALQRGPQNSGLFIPVESGLPDRISRGLSAATASFSTTPRILLTYESDALPTCGRRRRPWLLPASPRRCRRSSGSAARDGVPFVARGHGTGLSGGALPVAGGS